MPTPEFNNPQQGRYDLLQYHDAIEDPRRMEDQGLQTTDQATVRFIRYRASGDSEDRLTIWSPFTEGLDHGGMWRKLTIIAQEGGQTVELHDAGFIAPEAMIEGDMTDSGYVRVQVQEIRFTGDSTRLAYLLPSLNSSEWRERRSQTMELAAAIVRRDLDAGSRRQLRIAGMGSSLGGRRR